MTRSKEKVKTIKGIHGLRLLALLMFVALYAKVENVGQGNGDEALTATLSPGFATVRHRGTWNLELRFHQELPAGAAAKVRFVKAFGTPQIDDSSAANYVRVSTTSQTGKPAMTRLARRDQTVPWDWDQNAWIVTVTLTQGRLLAGEPIFLTYGANPPGGAMQVPVSAFEGEINIAYDLSGSGVFEEMQNAPRLTVLPDTVHTFRAHLPSQAVSGAEVNLTVVALDELMNLAPSFSGRLLLNTTDAGASLPGEVTVDETDSGRAVVPVTFHSPGFHYVRVEARTNSVRPMLQIKSNPIRVVAADSAIHKVFWGDLHSHTQISHDGHGTNSFAKARDVYCLDFYAQTDHSVNSFREQGGINPVEWEQTKRDVARFYEPGRFVTLLAFEQSLKAPDGHHNVFFSGSNEMLKSLPLYQDRHLEPVQSLWELYTNALPAGVEFLTIPHHTGMMWSESSSAAVTFGPGFGNREFRPLIEIYSGHGLSEAYDPGHALSYENVGPTETRTSAPGPHYAQDAWALGEMLGTIAASDDHSGRPGIDFNGLTAVLAEELTREAVFEALKNRRCYATTGQRMLLDFRVQGQLMGSIVEVTKGDPVRLQLEVHGTDGIEYAEILKWQPAEAASRELAGFQVMRRLAGAGSHMVGSFDDSSYAGQAIYYVRVKQINEIFDPGIKEFRPVWAWSSPVWVNDTLLLDADDPETLASFRLEQNYPNPVHDYTIFKYYLPVGQHVTIKLYDFLGRELSTLLDTHRSAGWHVLRLTGEGLASGIYFVRVQTAEKADLKKMLLLK